MRFMKSSSINKHQDKDSIPCVCGKNCKDLCEFYDSGFCHGVQYLSYPPKYGKCFFEDKGNNNQECFTYEEINGVKVETNDQTTKL